MVSSLPGRHSSCIFRWTVLVLASVSTISQNELENICNDLKLCISSLFSLYFRSTVRETLQHNFNSGLLIQLSVQKWICDVNYWKNRSEQIGKKLILKNGKHPETTVLWSHFYPPSPDHKAHLHRFFLLSRPSLCTRMRSATPKPSWQPSRSSLEPLSGCGASARKTTSRWGLSVRWLHPSCWKSPTSAELSVSAPISSGPVAALTKMARRCAFFVLLHFYLSLR